MSLIVRHQLHQKEQIQLMYYLFFTVWTIGPPSKTVVEGVISLLEETSIFDDSEVGSAVLLEQLVVFKTMTRILLNFKGRTTKTAIHRKVMRDGTMSTPPISCRKVRPRDILQ